MEEQIKVKLTAEMVISGTQEEVERFKYVVGLLAENPTSTGVDNTLQISAALLGAVQDYVLLLNNKDRGVCQAALKTVEIVN